MTPIEQFYSLKTVLITGGSGFLGKVLIEKLLRSFVDLEKIYLLLRCSRSSAQEKLETITQSPVFQHLHETSPAVLKKMHIIPSDMSVDGLALSDSDRNRLTCEVQLVFHCAANINFHDSLVNSINVNVVGTERLLSLAAEMTLLTAFVHVSTAFSQSFQQGEIAERVYRVPVDLEAVMHAAASHHRQSLRQLCSKQLARWPNVYTFSKSLAEMVVSARASNDQLPAAIVRPSIIVCAWQQPQPGWIDGVSFSTGFIAAFGKGVARTMLCDPSSSAEVIPVDLVVNQLLVAGWYTATQRSSPQPPAPAINNNHITPHTDSINSDLTAQVYNCVAWPHRSLCWSHVQTISLSQYWKQTMCVPLWYPGAVLTASRPLHLLCWLLLHLIPAVLADVVLFCCARRPRFFKMQRKMYRASSMFSFFALRRWKFACDNTERLTRAVSPADRHMFRFDTSQLNWEEYISVYIKGVQKFVTKEHVNPVSMRRRLWCLYLLHNLLKFGLLIAFVTILLNMLR